MKMRYKGKVYPSPSSSSSSSSTSPSTPNKYTLSILKLLPAAILSLMSVLSFEDREVLAYMITWSMKSANPPSILEEKKKNNKKSSNHKPPVFDCDCFDCYTSYWFRWDSSPNRELIHQAIEAFEEHLASTEKSKRNSRGKRRDKMSSRGNEKTVEVSEMASPERVAGVAEVDDGFLVVPPESKGLPLELSEQKSEWTEADGEEEVYEEEVAAPETAVVLRSMSENNHKGLTRKVLPDVVGLLNSRLWSLWSPNV